LVNIWRSYREFKGGHFFETQCIVAVKQRLKWSSTLEVRRASDKQCMAK